MKIPDLIQILNGDIGLIDQVNIRDEALLEDEVLVTPRHVRKMLINFLQGKVTSPDLTKWAMFITLRDEYVTVDPKIDCMTLQFDEIQDYYDGMWSIIQWISTPCIDGEVNTINVGQYLEKLDSLYKNDKYATLKPVPSLWETSS
jgi:hypothetical protein